MTGLENLILFDLDGVITSEEAYWDAAGLTLHELLYSPRYWNVGASTEAYRPAATAEESRRLSNKTFPRAEIMALKARAINSNWDTCYVAVCLHLIHLLALAPDLAALMPLVPWDADWLAKLRGQLVRAEVGDRVAQVSPNERIVEAKAVFGGYVGLEVINRFDVYASEVLGQRVEGVFSRLSPFWPYCQDIFQEWYLGDELYRETYGRVPAQEGKPGCIHFEQPLLPAEAIREALQALHEQGYTLGFATGRSLQEAEVPLRMQGLLEYFDAGHIATYDDVVRAEGELRAIGDETLLSKPHPFPFLWAAGAHQPAMGTIKRPVGDDRTLAGFVVVGDSTGDILGGKAAGGVTVAVVTGVRTEEARALLAASGPDFTVRDVTEVPPLLAQIDSLATIQKMQFQEREKAERLLRRWFARHMGLQTEGVRLTPKPVSLNSFNGFYRVGGEEYFFKTHVEEQGTIHEYYHADLLHRAGYNVVLPLRTLHEEGRQMVIYPVVRWPVMFDLMRAVETGKGGDVNQETLVAAERRACERLLDIYGSTLEWSSAEEHTQAPIHQLFWHRLTGGRLKTFYAGKCVSLPAGAETRGSAQNKVSFDEMLGWSWVINGVAQRRTLGELIERAKVVLDPRRAAMTVIGHGDAHFGNVFLENGKGYLYFDPAFAGRHSPLLDVVKPLFHNVFATWMYFPLEIAGKLQISVAVGDGKIAVEHDYALTDVRRAILRTKVEYLLRPLVAELTKRGGLPEDWLEIMRLALMCCPLLTVNLVDEERLPAAVGWLGLAMAVEMGTNGIEIYWEIE